MPYDAVMKKYKAGALKSGGSGKTVTNPKQAVAIMLSEKKKAATDPEYAGSKPGMGPLYGPKKAIGK